MRHAPFALVGRLFILTASAFRFAAAAPPRVLVVDFRPEHGADAGLGREVADALAVELMRTGSFEVIPREQMDQQMTLRDIEAPLSTEAAFALAKSLRAEELITGTVSRYVRDHPLGIRLILRLLLNDVQLRFAVSGAAVTVEQTAEPAGTVTAETLRLRAVQELTQRAVLETRSRPAVTGKVLLVDGQGNFHLDIGQRDGLKKGALVAVIRSELNPHTAERTVRKLGEARIVALGGTDSVARPVGGAFGARPLDRVRVIYTLPGSRRK